MPKHVEINSWAQLLMLCRAMRPLRIYTLVPHIRRVVVELFRGFKEIILVTILMIIVMFVFASFGVQTVGGRLAACNDLTIKSRVTFYFPVGKFILAFRKIVLGLFGRKYLLLDWKFMVKMMTTYIQKFWCLEYGEFKNKNFRKKNIFRMNPRNFNFDHVGNAMLALFETLSYKGWNVIRDILWARHGPVLFWSFFQIGHFSSRLKIYFQEQDAQKPS